MVLLLMIVNSFSHQKLDPQRKVKYCTVSERPTTNGAVVKGQTLKLKRRSPEHQVYEKLRAEWLTLIFR
ncbi:hypothetical protein RchiOBHm_Chr5g0043671 [Rosa chinensis]|uniref:Uncharacterized protein n=1 Tax=Rosa chinensis TaxID=74649 RepID=A0A2P6QDD3_ROSCH|nr:hypothetical protein RchiOBHm_Chr5g0043671 [Rosa chinensis]